MSEPIEPNAKVLFRVPNDDGTAEVETLWATALGDDKYKLDNSPFYAYSVSWQDIVYAPFNPEEGLPTFERVLSKSGNRTIRVLFDLPVEAGNASDQVMKGLVALGCDYEGANKRYVSVNIPPNVELESVRQYLIQCNATWEHGDPSYAELFPDGA
jgi:hypothetical protein